ncbi:hypothetical protein [Nocardia sp. CA-135398]|uniref:hypothetical protein n=1 Tax=Nocardia sp. CA-135398 TaxID=3239977 RepID=UPI003D997E77
MSTLMIVSLFLVLSCALNIAMAAGCIAKANAKSNPASILIGAGAAATALTVFFAALQAYAALSALHH